jgi:CarD family transcriptional regulator
MSTRKKATKKSTVRAAGAVKRTSKSGSSAKSKSAKTVASAVKPAGATKKAPAKSSKTVVRPGAASKAKVQQRAKTTRVAALTKSSRRKSTATKGGKVVKLQSSAHTRAAKSENSQAKERKAISIPKKKSDSVKKEQERLSTKVQSKTVESKAPAVDSIKVGAVEAPKVVLSSTGGLSAVAPPKPVKTVNLEKAASHETEEAMVQKTGKASPRQGFKTNEFVVYPAHGVGQIVAIEEQEVAGFRLELFVITFVKDKMTLRVPTGKVAGVGMRKLAEPDAVKKSLDILLGRARIKRTMWSRRAQEYETKINSGDLAAIAEVVRDLYRSEAQPEQSYSERQLYEAALDRMAREVAVVQKLTESEALKAIDAQLQKSQRRSGKAELEAVVSGSAESDVEEAA